MKSSITSLCAVSFIAVVLMLAAACSSLPQSNTTVEPKYSHTEITTDRHYLAYRGLNDMSIEDGITKWLAKAEKLCSSRDFDYEFKKQELRGKEFSKTKYPFIEGEIVCPAT